MKIAPRPSPKAGTRKRWDGADMQAAISAVSDKKMGFDISPVPVKVKKQSQRGRKAGKAQIITSSPYKKDLEDSINKINMKKTSLQNPNLGKRSTGKENKKKETRVKNGCKNLKFNTGKGKSIAPKNALRAKDVSSSENENDHFSLDDSSDESPDRRREEDAKCIYCEGLYSDDRMGEKWVQCISCKMWAHEECAGVEKDFFMCEFCIPGH